MTTTIDAPVAGTGLARVDRVVAAVVAAAAVAAAGSAFAACFTTGRLVGLVALGAGAGGVAGAVLTAAWRPAIARLVGAAVLLGGAVAGGIGSAAPATVGRAVVDGPRRLLTTGLPADADLAARSVPVLVCFLGAATAVALARRGRAAGLPATALAVVAIGTAAGIPAGPSRIGVVVATTAALLLAVAAAGLVRPGPAATRTGPGARPVVRRRRPLGALVLVVVAVVAGVGVAAAAGDDSPERRASLRDAVSEPALPTDLRNPLDTVALALGAPDDVIYGTVRRDRPEVTRLPIATFDAYDGDTFLFGTVVSAGGAAPTAPGTPVSQELDLDTWPFASLPHAGPARSVEGPVAVADRVGIDERTGRVVVGEGGAGAWTVGSVADATTVAPSTALDVDRDVPPARDLPTDQLVTIAEEAQAELARSGTTVGLVQSLAERFRTLYRAVPAGAPPDEQRGGHGALVLGCIVNAGFSGQPTACADRVGTRTQLGAAFVLVLRRLGIPARLAVGWELAPTTSAQPLRSHSLTAWAEVAVPGGGWFAVDPVPERAGETGDLGSSAGETRAGSSAATGEDTESADGDAPASAGGGRRSSLLVIAAGVVVLVGLAAVPALARRRRLRRRRRGSGAERLVGAWHEMRDQVRERGVVVPPGTHVTDVVRLHGVVDPTIAVAVNAVAFGGDPGADGDAERAWAALVESDRAWRSEARPRDRARRYLRLGPVVGRR